LSAAAHRKRQPDRHTALIDEIESYTDFAPLHTPIAVYIMREALRLFPGTPTSLSSIHTSIAPCRKL